MEQMEKRSTLDYERDQNGKEELFQWQVWWKKDKKTSTSNFKTFHPSQQLKLWNLSCFLFSDGERNQNFASTIDTTPHFAPFIK